MQRQDDTIYYLLAGSPGGGGGAPISARTGPVRVNGRAYSDAAGDWNAVGASVFWALWGEANDPDRLDKNLRYLAEHGFTFVRILGMVGTSSWADRVIDPFAANYWPTVDSLFARLASVGLRAQVTIFADAQVMMPNHGDRQRFVDQWGDKEAQYQDRVHCFEMWNEAWQNGGEDIDAMRELGKRLADQTSVGVALSSMPQVQDNVNWCEAYHGHIVDFVSIHYDRDCSKADGPWRPVRQPWGFPIEYDGGCGMPAAAQNNEPIGPDSSVAEDWDPLRLALGVATTFISGNCGHVYHCGAGIRGGGQADLNAGRRANIYDYPPEICAAIRNVIQVLPPGIANWRRFNSGWPGFPWDGIRQATEDGRLTRAYCAVGGNQTALVLINQSGSITARADVGYRMTRFDALTGMTTSEDVPAGTLWRLEPTQPGSLFLGTAL